MPLLDRNGVGIYYEVHGTGPALLLSNGYGATTAMWQSQIADLSKQHTLVLWDMRGHGRSDSPDENAQYSADLTIADMAALLDVVEAKTAIVGGLSLGGYMSLAFHASHPERVRALLLCSTGPGFRKDDAREAWNQRAKQTAIDWETDGPARLQRLSSEPHKPVHRSATGLARAARGMLAQPDGKLIETLPRIAVPTLVVVGADDSPFIAPADYMAAKIPGARKVVIPTAGHFVNVDQPAIFNREVGSFLRTLG